MADKIILGLSGSASKKSYNTALLRAFGEVLPDGAQFKLFENLTALPYYTPDLDQDEVPELALQLRTAIGGADALIVSSPEYNYSISALIKNTIDWASRPYGKQVLIAKPILIAGASPGQFGTIRAQSHLRDILHATQSKVLTRPEIFLTMAAEKFDENMKLTDAPTIEILEVAAAALLEFVGKDTRGSAA